MIILNKKRLLLMISAVLISIGVFSISMSREDNVVQTVALPVSNKVIVIDARAWCTRWGELLINPNK